LFQRTRLEVRLQKYCLFATVVAAPKITVRTIFHVGVSGEEDSSVALLWLVRESDIALKVTGLLEVQGLMVDNRGHQFHNQSCQQLQRLGNYLMPFILN
jgi:hypothetical protein